MQAQLKKKSLHNLGSKAHQSYFKLCLCDSIDVEVTPSPCTSNFFSCTTNKEANKERSCGDGHLSKQASRGDGCR
jgi:hypothetical protein